MKVSFRKMAGDSELGISFFWLLKIEADTPIRISDYFIPELFYDYFYVEEGAIQCSDLAGKHTYPLPQQALKTIHKHSLVFSFAPPLVLFGARLSLPFAEFYWENDLASRSFIEDCWVDGTAFDLASFASHLTKSIQLRRISKTKAPMLSPTLEEAEWFLRYSQRHKRRLYKTVFGINRKDMLAIQKVHTFLGQSCDFTSHSPRIVEYVDDDTFYDQPHLNHAFKKVTGLSPMAYFGASSLLQDNLMAASYNENFD